MKPLLASLLLLIGCERELGPDDPVWGKQPCDHCRMLVSDPHFAAQLVDASGRRLYFDDVGCMAAHLAEVSAPKKQWVRDADSGVWLDAKNAFFRSGASTPMDYGFSAHRDPPGTTFEAMKQATTAKRETADADHHH